MLRVLGCLLVLSGLPLVAHASGRHAKRGHGWVGYAYVHDAPVHRTHRRKPVKFRATELDLRDALNSTPQKKKDAPACCCISHR